jgi:hypothetical protein
MTPTLNEFGIEIRRYCECCTPYRTSTSTATSHKWTKKEIEQEIIYCAGEVARATWWSRKDRTRRLSHWVEKLERFNEFN